jgi:hypothetical protein
LIYDLPVLVGRTLLACLIYDLPVLVGRTLLGLGFRLLVEELLLLVDNVWVAELVQNLLNKLVALATFDAAVRLGDG